MNTPSFIRRGCLHWAIYLYNNDSCKNNYHYRTSTLPYFPFGCGRISQQSSIFAVRGTRHSDVNSQHIKK